MTYVIMIEVLILIGMKSSFSSSCRSHLVLSPIQANVTNLRSVGKTVWSPYGPCDLRHRTFTNEPQSLGDNFVTACLSFG